MHEIEKKALEQARREARDGRITCAKALAVAKAAGFPAARMGRLLDSGGIKIIKCQLGCFGWKKLDPEPESS
jgi:hypothetical protein